MEDPDLAVALRYDAGAPTLRAWSPGPRRDRRADLAVAVSTGSRSGAIGISRRCWVSLELDSPIPIAAFAAVAEILAHLYRANHRLQDARR